MNDVLRWGGVLMLALNSGALGQIAPKPGAAPKPLDVLAGRPDQEGGAEVLGPAFESATGGISLRPPLATSKILRRAVNGDDIAEFISDDNNWALKLSKISFSQPV